LLVSYSTREPHVQHLIECLRIVFVPHLDVKLTPSALESGASQREQITKLIEGCSFAVVCLDGLRPNVVFEYGILHGRKKPVMLFREGAAQVDIRSFVRDPAGVGVVSVPLDLDSQFSDAKDAYCARWNRFEISTTVKLIWDEYHKKRKEIQGFIEIPEPKLCT